LNSAPANLALSLPVGELPDGAGDSIWVGGGVQVGVHEGLRDGRASLRVVAVGHDLSGVDVLVGAVVEVEGEGDVGRQVELRVERAGAVAGLDRGGGRELVDVGGTGGGSVQALLDAVALVLDLREGQVDFGDDAGDIEAARVADAAVVLRVEVWADAPEAAFVVLVVVTGADWAGENTADGEEWEDGCESEMHCGFGRVGAKKTDVKLVKRFLVGFVKTDKVRQRKEDRK
jgi:hypothetical protein